MDGTVKIRAASKRVESNKTFLVKLTVKQFVKVWGLKTLEQL